VCPSHGRRFAQTAIPINHRQFDRISQTAEPFDLRTEFPYLVSGKLYHLPAWSAARVTHTENVFELSQRESRVEGVANQADPLE